MFLIVGLGNPEKKYEKTRHNVGFLAVEELANTHGATWKIKNDLSAEIAEIHTEGKKLILAKPQTYMNLSGKAVTALMKRYHLEPQQLIVLCDDIDLPVGTIRTRTEGSSGGHNGLKSIIASLGTQQFFRVKIGVGAHPINIPLEKWVLSVFPPEEAQRIPDIIKKVGEITQDITCGKVHPQTTHALPSSPDA